MKFVDPEQAPSRARAVLALLPRSSAPRLGGADGARLVVSRVAHSGSALDRPAVFDAVNGYISWDDIDGERRQLTLPTGVTTEAVAALLFAVSTVAEWS